MLFKAIYGPKALGAFMYNEEDLEIAKFAPSFVPSANRRNSIRPSAGQRGAWKKGVRRGLGANRGDLDAGRGRHQRTWSWKPVGKYANNIPSSVNCRSTNASVCSRSNPHGATGPGSGNRSLASLLPTLEERREAWNMAKDIALGDGVIDAKQQVVLDRLSQALELKAAA